MPMHKSIPAGGKSAFSINMFFDAVRTFDMDYKGGQVFAYVYPTDKGAEAVAKRAYMSFITENGLDFTVFPSVLRMENEVVSMIASLLRAPPDAAGNVTSGGTESVFLAVKTARDWARAEKGIKEPELVVPVTAHSCFHKAAHLLDMKIITTPIDPKTRKASVAAMRAACTENTCMVAGSAVCYPFGVVDPIEEIAGLAAEKGILCHVDGCIGAFVLEFYRQLGRPVPKFDFADCEGVTSMSVDLHKYAFCLKNASVVMYRSKALRKFQIFSHSSWPGYTMVNPTMQSTKSGGPVAAAWATINYIGVKGYRELIGDIATGTDLIAAGVADIPGLRLASQPESNLVAFTSDTVPLWHLADAMRKKGWFIQPQLSFDGMPATIHISVNPQAAKKAPAMLRDLRQCAKDVQGMPDFAGEVAKVRELTAKAPGGKLTPELYEELLEIAGMSRTSVPQSMARINAIMDSFDSSMREQLLTLFANDAFQHDEELAMKEEAEFIALKKGQAKRAVLKWLPAVVAVAFIAYRRFRA
eukprot:TRINITY_DN47084_c0_g1_i1.p2 TRINITY_DN47084_c0_g1~~TRINITY_DN47084_c0_g1_i1.p2  ORF type:complete len:528 (+),score=188.33 TRINITY_DN47084_c0_g1_i1:61-1644(+)